MNSAEPNARAAMEARREGRARLRAVTATVGAVGLVGAGVVAFALPGSHHAASSTGTGASSSAGSNSSGSSGTGSGSTSSGSTGSGASSSSGSSGSSGSSSSSGSFGNFGSGVSSGQGSGQTTSGGS
jgi:hypothetical protein